MTDTRPPSVDSVVRRFDDGNLPRPLVVEAVREVIDLARQDPTLSIEDEVRSRLHRIRRSAPQRVVNATGVLLHTNLGRAPWSLAALNAAAEVATGYANVELDLETGERGRRNPTPERLLRLLTGAEAALVVNNNAAALLLTLMALAPGGRVPVSRGELIEIGGSYRLPELMAASGADLIEVGTTNRTRIGDYAAVADAALLLKVHPSNYRIVGFSTDTTVTDLVDLARQRQIPCVFDIGSGLLDENVPWLDGPPPSWLKGEPGVRQALAAGVDLVTFSGDKLLGGPQAGIVVGRADLVQRLSKHPAARAMRVDGPTAAALAATLTAYLTGEATSIPLWKMATTPAAEIERRARSILGSSGRKGRIAEGVSTLGAGSAPGAEIPTHLLKLEGGDEWFERLLVHDPPVLARREAGELVIDLRTVDPADDPVVAAALSAR